MLKFFIFSIEKKLMPFHNEKDKASTQIGGQRNIQSNVDFSFCALVLPCQLSLLNASAPQVGDSCN